MADERLHEETISTETVYSGKLMEVVKEKVRLPNGKMTIREAVKHRGVVAIVPLVDGEVVMVRQLRQACGKILLEVPAGTLNIGETPDECARRELVEETGYVSGRLKRILRFYVSPGHCSELVHLYLATDLSQSVQDMEEDEFISVLKIDLDSALQMIERNEIEDAKSIAGILYLERYLKKR